MFSGQFKSVEKLKAGKELSLYEKCSIYTMHTAVWAIGWPLSPVAAHECFSLHFPHKEDTVTVWNTSRRIQVISPKVQRAISSLTSKPIGSYTKVAWNGNEAYAKASPEHVAAIAINPCTITKAATMQDGSFLYLIHSSMQYPKYSETKFNLGFCTITIHEGLFRYLQDKKWLSCYTAEYGIYGSWLQ